MWHYYSTGGKSERMGTLYQEAKQVAISEIKEDDFSITIIAYGPKDSLAMEAIKAEAKKRDLPTENLVAHDVSVIGNVGLQRLFTAVTWVNDEYYANLEAHGLKVR